MTRDLLLERSEQLFRALRAERFIVLIWGSGPQSPENYSKRGDIRRVIEQDFPNAKVVFSEDAEVRATTEPYFPTIVEEERVHIELADLILALDTGEGVSHEISRFSAYDDVVEKLVVFANLKSGEQLSFKSEVRRRKVEVQYYSDDDFLSCNLAKKICLKYVYSTVFEKYLRKKRPELRS